MMRKVLFGACCLLVALSTGAASGFAGQEAGSAASEPLVVEPQAVSQGPETYGTLSEGVAVIAATQLMPSSSAVTFTVTTSPGIGVFETSSSGDWWGEAFIPSGALALRVELEACDTDAAGALLFGMARSVSPGVSAANITPVGSTGATPGCAFFPVAVTTPVAMNNGGTYLHLFLNYGSTSATNKANVFRVFYKLQVSPAPGVATFADVPVGAAQHRFVEALVAAGITGGCGGGNYCPNDAVTRGQMAVFIAVALGLHFAP